MNCVYNPCPSAPYDAVQSRYSILSHDTLQHRFSSNNGLENGDRELGHLFCYYMSCKTLSTILLGECAFFTTGICFKSADLVIRHLACSYNTVPFPYLLKWATCETIAK